jgi:hypothetical protein
MQQIDMDSCEQVGGGLSPMGVLSVWNWGATVVNGLVTTVGYLGGTLRNYYGEDAALEAFRGGNLGA